MEVNCVLGVLVKDGKILMEQSRPVGDAMGINTVIHVMEKDIAVNRICYLINEYVGCTSPRTNNQLHGTGVFPPQSEMPATGYDVNPDFWTMPSTSPSRSTRQYQQDYDLQAGFVQTMCSSLEVMSDGVSRTILLQRFAQCQVKMRQIRREAAANGVRIIESPYENMTAPSPR